MAVVMASVMTAAAQPGVLQPTPAPAAPAEKPALCIRGGETCTTLLLLETTWGVKPVVATRDGNNAGGDLGLEGGLLVNTGDHQGFGGSIGLRFRSEAEDLAVVWRARYRRYLSPHSNLDASLGLMTPTVNRGGYGGTGQVSFERTGKIALVLSVDVYRNHRNGVNENAVEVGLAVKFCGLVAVPTALLTLLIASFGRGTG